MKRTLALAALAFVIFAPPVHAQDGEWRIQHNDVQVSGEATDGTCPDSRESFPFRFGLHLGPGNEARATQGGKTTSVGKFDPETGTITLSKGTESKTLRPDGETGLTGTYESNGCTWILDLETNMPALLFVEPEVATGCALGKGGGYPLFIAVALAIIGGSGFALWVRRRSPEPATETPEGTAADGGGPETVAEEGPELQYADMGIHRCKKCGFEAGAPGWKRDSRGALVCPDCSGQDVERIEDDDDDEDEPDRLPPGQEESKEPDLNDEIDPPRVIS